MSKLILRMLRKTIAISLAVAALFATSLTILLLYNSYLDQASRTFEKSMTARIPENHFLVKFNNPGIHKHVGSFAQLVSAWEETTVETSLGALPAALFSEISEFSRNVPPNSAIVHPYLARRYDITEGDTITATIDGNEYTLTIANIYTDFSLTQGYDFGERLLIYTGEIEKFSFMLYKGLPTDLKKARSQLNTVYGMRTITERADELRAGATGVQRRLNALTQAKLSLVGFIAVAFLTAKMMAFLENRRVMAILKATGLRNTQVGLHMGIEALFSPVVGSILGLVAGWQVLRYLEAQGSGLTFSLSAFGHAALWLLPPAMIGIMIPSRLGNVATVNELIFHRSIPLFREQVDSLRRSYPQLDSLKKQGIHLLRLELIGGVFEGFIFRHVGDTVRKNEVIAQATNWWGLKVIDYVSPIDGKIVYYDEQTGIIGVHP